MMSDIQKNPLLFAERVGKYEAIPFNLFKKEHYIPAVDFGLEEAKNNLEAIKANTEEPTFENTIFALSNCSPALDKATTVFFNLLGAESDNEFKALAQEISPKIAAFSSSISTDPVLFEKVKAVYDKRDSLNLSEEEMRIVKNSYKGFTRNGALLSDEDKEKLKAIDQELSRLSPTFNQNLLNSTNAYEMHITDEADLEGIPENAKMAAKHTAEQRGKDGWVFTLQFPSMLPVSTYAKKRELRQQISSAFKKRAFRDEFDNQATVLRTVELRTQRAKLLGYNTHADYVITERMAESPENVINFLNRIYEVAYPKAKEELQEIKDLAKEMDGIEELETWDFGYYSEILKKKKFDFDSEELRPYLKADNCIQGVFDVSSKLYGLKYKELHDIPVYHEDVRVFDVTDEEGKDIGILYLDLFPRATKRGGAWMTTFRDQGLSDGVIKRPHVAIVANLTPPTGDRPALLSYGELRTLFHEFGHALHGLLSNCKYKAVASPNVLWDFVELPSQIMENWIKEKEALDMFAVHHETGERIPEELIKKVQASETYNKGYMNIRQVAFGDLDMGWHYKDTSEVKDVKEYEDKLLARTSLFPASDESNMSCAFAHIFAGGYSAGYYSYKWAEVLEADAFQYFKDTGIFNKETAAKFRTEILEKGDSKHPMELYKAFRGHEPEVDSLLKRDGLI